MSPLAYPPPTLDQAWSQAIDQAAAITLPESLWQRPQVQGITIDSPTSRDLDDAIWIESAPTGAIASIHIADVSEIVTLGTALDKVALARTQTRYFGQRNDPMLPHSLSEDKLSLLEGRQRPTLTIQVSLNDKAEIQTTELFESWLISSKRFSYEQADLTCQKQTMPFHEQLNRCQAWAERLNQERQSKGAIGGLFSQSGFLLDENGNVIIPNGKLFHSQMIIQEFMILANRAVAHWFAERDVLALYRNHTPRAIAPEREEMMQALLTTGSIELIRQKLQNWLNKAEYNPSLIGHFALNLTAYCHFTSPIRRLADLINHRIIKTILHGKPHPYRRFELEQLCKYIATITLENENTARTFHKARKKQKYQTQLQNAEALQALSDKEFGNVLKHAAREDNFEPIRDAAIVRLEQGQLSIQDLYLLLIRSGDPTFQHRILEMLQAQPQTATSILAIAINQEQTWDNLDYVEGNDTSPFITWTEVLIDGQVKTTVYPAENGRKQRSRHLACLNWLEAFVSGELVPPEQRLTPEPPAVEESETQSTEISEESAPALHPILLNPLQDDQNFVGLLQELCQTLGWDLPDYQFTGENADFICACTLVVQGQHFNGQAAAAKKKQAKHWAAKDTLVRLQKWFRDGERVAPEQRLTPEPPAVESSGAQSSEIPEESAPALHPILLEPLQDDQNFVGLLQELCQTMEWDFPDYQFTGENADFICTCTVVVQDQRFSGQAAAAKKKQAKHWAAKDTLVRLQRWFRYGELAAPEPQLTPKPPAIEASGAQSSEIPEESAPALHPILLEPLQDDQNFVGLLQELCQTLGWDLPDYQFTGENADFVYTCTLVALGQSFSGEAAAAKKKQAKRLAAKDTLVRLRQWFQDNEKEIARRAGTRWY